MTLVFLTIYVTWIFSSSSFKERSKFGEEEKMQPKIPKHAKDQRNQGNDHL